uniref:Sulfotransferase n=1 Tax=Pygocentrus nattereri TaxID=42514 RepID=A0AAR2L7Y9_PYGNA
SPLTSHINKLTDFEGVSLVHFITDNWENIKNFKARPDDILIATHPKAGTTWVSYILDLLYFGNTSPERQTSLPIYLRVPFLEANFPETPSARNAKDSAVSYYHFDRMNMISAEPGDWNTYLQRFMDGKTMFGPWYNHVCGYWEKKQTYPNLHYMFFEDMVEVGNTLRKRITKGVHFDAMKQNKMTNYSAVPVMDFKISPFMRKGKVGDWKNHFTVAQNEQFDKHYKEKMKSTTLQFRTQI